MKVDPYLPPCTKLSSEWVKDLDVKLEAQKQLEGETGLYFKIQALAVAGLIDLN